MSAEYCGNISRMSVHFIEKKKKHEWNRMVGRSGQSEDREETYSYVINE